VAVLVVVVLSSGKTLVMTNMYSSKEQTNTPNAVRVCCWRRLAGVVVVVTAPEQQATGPARTEEDVQHRLAYHSIAFGVFAVVVAAPPVAMMMMIGGGGLSMTRSTGNRLAHAPCHDDDKDDGIESTTRSGAGRKSGHSIELSFVDG
jgi:hypothetical protein